MNFSILRSPLGRGATTSNAKPSFNNPTVCKEQAGPIPIIELLSQWQNVRDGLEGNAWQGYQQLSKDQKCELAPLLAQYWQACADLLPAPSVIGKHLTAYSVTNLSRDVPWIDVLSIYSSCLSADDMHTVQSGLVRLNQAMADIKHLFKRFDAQRADQKSGLYLSITMRLCGLFCSLLSHALALLQLVHMLYRCTTQQANQPIKTGKEQWEELAEQLKMFWMQEMYTAPSNKEAIKKQIQKELAILLETKQKAS